jgi:hypothetical protein
LYNPDIERFSLPTRYDVTRQAAPGNSMPEGEPENDAARVRSGTPRRPGDEMNTYVAEKPAVATTLALCFAIALLEGLDLQSVGVAAPRMAHEFGLTVSQMGLAFSAGTLGLLPGAMIGGRLADRIGRKRVLLASVALFGLLSLATAQVSTFAMLVFARFLTGLGLGGAMPNLIALSSESVGPQSRSTAVTAMYCGVSFGGVIASLVGVMLVGHSEWRHIFYVGGAGPLLLLPLLIGLLPESRAYLDVADTAANRVSVAQTLFGNGRTLSTLELWISNFCTLVVLYFLLNWLPSLIQHRRRTRRTRHRHIDGPHPRVTRCRRRHVCGHRAVARRARGRAGRDVARGGGIRSGAVRDRCPVGALCARRDLLPDGGARHRGGCVGRSRQARLRRRSARGRAASRSGPQCVRRHRCQHPSVARRRADRVAADRPAAR